jgi:hypothetical protein
MPAIFWILAIYISCSFRTIGPLLVLLYPGVPLFWLIMHLGIERWPKLEYIAPRAAVFPKMDMVRFVKSLWFSHY